MARINNLQNFLTDVATAIKNKKGDETAIPAANFDIEITNLPSQGVYQHKTTTIAENGTVTILPDTGYDAIDQLDLTVNIPLQQKTYTFTQNTTTTITPEQGYVGFSQVGLEINVPSSQPNLQDKTVTITVNGQQTIVADSGYDGLSQVIANVNVPSGGLTPLHIHRDAIVAVQPTISYNTEGNEYTFELGNDGYYCNTNTDQNNDSELYNNTTAAITVSASCVNDFDIIFDCYQSSEEDYDYGVITVIGGNEIYNAKGLSGTSSISYHCEAGSYDFRITYLKDGSTHSGQDIFKFKVRTEVNNKPAVDVDAYIAHTDDFNTYISDTTIPVNTTVVTYNEDGLVGTGYTKQSDGTWKQVGIYNDKYSISSNIKRGVTVNGVTGSYVDLSNYGNLSIIGENIVRPDQGWFDCYNSNNKIYFNNIRLNLADQVICNIQYNTSNTFNILSSFDNNISVTIPIGQNTLNDVNLGYASISNFAYNSLYVLPELEFVEVTATDITPVGLQGVVSDVHIYKNESFNMVKYSLVKNQQYDNYSGGISFLTASGTDTLSSAGIWTTSGNTFTPVNGLSIVGSTEIKYRVYYIDSNKSPYTTYYAGNDVEQKYPMILETVIDRRSYDSSTQTVSNYLMFGIRCDALSNQDMSKLTLIDITIYEDNTKQVELCSGQLANSYTYLYNYEPPANISIDNIYVEATLNIYNVEGKDYANVYIKSLDNQYFTVSEAASGTKLDKLMTGIESRWSSYNYGQTRFETGNAGWNFPLTYNNAGKFVINLEFFGMIDIEANERIEISAADIAAGNNDYEFVAPIAKDQTKYVIALNPYCRTQDGLKFYAKELYENYITDANDTAITTFYKYGNSTYRYAIISDTLKLKILAHQPVLADLPNQYAKFNGTYNITAKNVTPSNGDTNGYGVCYYSQREYQVNSCILSGLKLSNDASISGNDPYKFDWFKNGTKQNTNPLQLWSASTNYELNEYLLINDTVEIRIYKNIGGTLSTNYYTTSYTADTAYTTKTITVKTSDIENAINIEE